MTVVVPGQTLIVTIAGESYVRSARDAGMYVLCIYVCTNERQKERQAVI